MRMTVGELIRDARERKGITQVDLAERVGVSRLVREIARLAGVKASPHDFRRAFVERMQAQGMPDTLLQQLTGHRSTQMIVRYGRRKASENALRLQRQYMGGVG
jgi:integrase